MLDVGLVVSLLYIIILPLPFYEFKLVMLPAAASRSKGLTFSLRSAD